jgi:undecaprenyl-diphosphatase
VRIETLDDLERNVCLRVNSLSRRTATREFFGAVSRLGDYPAYVVLGFIAAIYPGVPGKSLLIQAVLTGLVGVLAYKQLKSRLVRERPFIRFGEIVCGAAPLDRYSFPSGHTLHAVSFTILFGSYIPELLWIMVPFAFLVALSRVILGLHYPSDVLVGALLGALLATTGLYVATPLAGIHLFV